jgi:hypothetical protein
MTQLMQDSTWAEPAANASRDFRASTHPAPIQEERASRPSLRAQRRPAAALAADVNELLESMARKRVPRVDAVRQQLQDARAGMHPGDMEHALHALHAATAAVDFLAGRTGGDRAGDFLRQGDTLAAASARLGRLAADFLQREAVEAPVARLVWINLVLESGSLHKRVRQGAHWLAEMDQDLLHRRKGRHTDVTLRAIDELARRGISMHERLQTVHRFCGHARTVHGLCEDLAAERAALCATLQDRLLPACGRLEEALQPLLHAAAYRALVPIELIVAIDALHELQVMLTQAAAQIVRLEASDRDLALQLTQMEEKGLRLA